MGLNESIIKIRVDLQNKQLSKSGKNKFAGFEYFELSDFMPSLNALMLGEGVNDCFYIREDNACLQLIKGEEDQTYTIPFTHYQTPTNKQGAPSMQDIQYLGALITYYKRYLYMNAFGITDGEIVDAMDTPSVPQRKVYQTWSKASDEDKKNYKKEFMQRASVYGLEGGMGIDFFTWLGVDTSDHHALHNAAVKFLKSEEFLGEQVAMYIEYKRKNP